MATDGSRHVAVVDDERPVRELIRSVLGRSGIAAEAFESADDFLYRGRLETFDLILCDLVMPGATGLDVLREVRARGHAAPFVIVTGQGSIPSAVEAMKEGAADYLLKPFRPQELVAFVERLLGRVTSEPVGEAEGSVAVGRSPVWLELLARARRAAEANVTVLILGETGTGKEVLARYVASHGPRARKPFVTLNCSAIPDTLIESELFGHARGAFTGATAPRRGLFEEADGGTLFLDEIGTMPLSAQAKILRALDERRVRRVGENRPIDVDVRILAATNADLVDSVKRREFREDLYYRLSVVTLRLPPLRERPEDVPLLADHFLERVRATGPRKRLSPAAQTLFERHGWPGNVRELRHAVEQAVALSTREVLAPEDFPGLLERPSAEARSTGAHEDEPLTAERLRQALADAGGSRVEAARLLGVSRSTLYRLLQRFSLEEAGEESRSADGGGEGSAS